jgi:hypothetical protein
MSDLIGFTSETAEGKKKILGRPARHERRIGNPLKGLKSRAVVATETVRHPTAVVGQAAKREKQVIQSQ